MDEIAPSISAADEGALETQPSFTACAVVDDISKAAAEV